MFNRFCFGALLLAGLVLPLTSCVSSPSLTSITVSPTTMNFGGAGLTTQLTATGYYTHPNHPAETKDITDQVTWASSTPECVTVSKTGFITSGGNVCSNIPVTASAPGFNGLISGSMIVNVTQSTTGGGGGSPTEVASLTIIPSSQTVATAGQTGQFIAIGTTGAGTTEDLSSSAVWTSSSTGVAIICSAGSAAPCTTSTAGLATAVGAGTTTITAVYTNTDGTSATGQATFTVTGASTSPLQSLGITPGTETILQGQSSQLIAIGTFSSTSSTPGTQNMTSQVTWNSSNTSVASITSGGYVTAVGAGAAVITAIAPAVDGNLVAAATITVTSPATGTTGEPLTSLAILPSSQTLTTSGQTANLIVIGTTSAGTTVNLTNQPVTLGTSTIKAATWTSSVPSVAKIDPATGIATAQANGATAITVLASNPDGTVVTGTGTLTVNLSATPEPLQGLTIIPGSVSVAYPGQQGQFTAVGTTSAGTTVNLTNQAAAVGTATIPAVVWSSSNKGVATVNAATGLVTAQGQGTAVIMAVGTNPDTSVVTNTATFAVQNAASEPVTAITIVPGTQSIAANQTAQFIALGTDGTTGLQEDLTTMVAWTSSNPGVATVGSPEQTGTTPGLVAGVSAGTTTITAQYTNQAATPTTPAIVVTETASVTVTAVTATPEPLLSLSIIPPSQTVSGVGATAQYLAIGTTSTGASEDLTNSVAWVSSEINVATIQTGGTSGTTTGGVGEPAGLATGVGAGTTAITAVWTNPADKTVVTGVATFTCPSGTSTTTTGSTTSTVTACDLTPGGPALQEATLTVIGMGTATGTVANPGNWLVTAPSGTGAENAIHCGPGSNASPSTLGVPVCSGTYPSTTTNLVLTTTVPAGGNYTFGGWSASCTPVVSPTDLTATTSSKTGPNYCVVNTLSNDETVAAIFNVVN
jgi:hypothetical protein